MAKDLLERDRELAALATLLDESATGQGHIALISGEAGIGKTALVERFATEAQRPGRPHARTVWAACEALFTPRPLGPLYDIARQTTPQLRALLDGAAHRAALFAALFDVLARSPTILIIEDIHWADEATLDLIKYVARRLHGIEALLILTYRDDELVNEHPLRLLLGDLPARDVTRLHLRPLSEGAVAALAERAHRPHGSLHAITGGNPFFLVEVLAHDAPGAPASVADAVLARIARRSQAAQRLLETVAVAPGRIERWVLEAVGTGNQAALDECLAAHLLRLEGLRVAFRHELARQAVEDALPPARRQRLHAVMLSTLLERGAEQTSQERLVHHAAQAEDGAQVVRLAPAAARQASAQGAHREAAAYYQTALRFPDFLSPERQAELLEGLANEYYLTSKVQEAVAPCEAALAIWRELDKTEQVGRTLRRLSRLSWMRGINAEAERLGLAAVAALEQLDPGRELAMACANLAHLGTRTFDPTAAIRWSERAIALAEPLGDHETVSYALNSLGAANFNKGDESAGLDLMERSLELALRHGHEEHAARAYGNLAIVRVNRYDFARGERTLRDGIAYCGQRDLDPWGHFLRWVRGRMLLDQGKWGVAEAEMTELLSVPWMAITNRLPALLVLARARARRGKPGVQALLDEARDLALAIGEPQRNEQVAAARAEWRWLAGDLAGCAEEAGAAFQPACDAIRSHYQDEVAVWLWRAGGLSEPPPCMRAPYALETAGDWRGAAEAWEGVGCHWEQALALLGGDEAAQRASLALFERLGSAPAAEIARRHIRGQVGRGLARGPRAGTLANPQGLTSRELEVLPLLADGLRNADIADRLSTSPRTIEHHVTKVLMKLNARSRAEAVRRAFELGLLAPAPSAPSGTTGG
jgi:DNA-binding CsgD family transcriptional regulator/tetratricopeptide (TPR) repeat protein